MGTQWIAAAALPEAFSQAGADLVRTGKLAQAALFYGSIFCLNMLPGLPLLAWVAGLAWRAGAHRPDLLALWLASIPVVFALLFGLLLGYLTDLEALLLLIGLMLTAGFWWMTRAHVRAEIAAEHRLAARFD